ncbi:MAG: O-antigen ligase family protein [Solirubrobacterales bacterium]
MASPLELIGLIAACGAAAAAILAPRAGWQPAALVIALLAAPLLVLGDVWDGSRVSDLREDPAVVAAALGVAAAAVAVGAVVMRRIEWAFPVLALAALALRLPVRFGGETSNLLIPLYLVITSQLAATLGRGRPAPAREALAVVWLRRALAATLVLYAVQAAYSDDVSNAIENAGFFLVPFAVLFCQLAAFRWDERALRAAAIAVGVVGAALATVAIAQFAARDLIFNKDLLDSNQIKPFFRVNSLFFDPNVLGRYMALGVIAMGAAIAWSRGGLAAIWGLAGGALMLAGLALSFSLTSIAALLAGLGVLALLRYGLRGGVAAAAAILATGAVFVVSGGLDRPDIGPVRGFDEETSGRGALLEGGFDLITDEPVLGWGSGAFGRAYFDEVRKTETTASHSEPITVAAEQGIPGAVVYIGLLAAMAWALLGGGAGAAAGGVGAAAGRAAASAGVVALVVHSLGYAGFLTDPATWALLALAVGLRSR